MSFYTKFTGHKFRIPRALFTPFLLLGLVLVSGIVAAIEFSDVELAELKSGNTIHRELPTSGTKGFYGGSGWAVVDAPADVIWKLLVDWDAYTRVFPNTTEATELSRKGEKSLVRFRLGHPLVSLTYHVEMERKTEKKILSFRLVENMPNDVNSIRGYWRLFPQKNGRTLIAYVVAVKVPMGLVNLAGPDLERKSILALLRIPGDIKLWVEGPNGKKYR
jgi:carbon monoxide dehydrogenase subunit G